MDQCPGSLQREETSVWKKSQNWAQSASGKGQPEALQHGQRAVVKQRRSRASDSRDKGFLLAVLELNSGYMYTR